MNSRAKKPDAEFQSRPILMVEDNVMDVDMAIQAFADNRIANPVVVCRDGAEALAFIAAHSTPQDWQLPAVVLLDLHLPKVDGIEVLRQARQHPIWKQVPFVILSMSRDNADISAAYALGVNSFIVKPASFTAFNDVVRQINAYWLLMNEPPFAQATRSYP
jgi:CheY-like chemotaxis protein